MYGNSGYDGCRSITRGSSVPVDGRKEAVSLDLVNIQAFRWVDFQDLSRPCVSIESTKLGERENR